MADHAQAREADHEVVPAPISDEVAAVVAERFPGTVFVESHGQAVVYVERER
jgi:hypothetical protein